MNTLFIFVYLIIAILLAATDIYFSGAARSKGTMGGRLLSVPGFLAAAVDIIYMFSMMLVDARLVSVCSSLYFIAIDWAVLSLLRYVFYLTSDHRPEKIAVLQKKYGWLQKLLVIYAVIDSAIQALNPFLGITVSFVRRNDIFARYRFGLKPLYYGHLFYAYLLIFACLFLLVRKSIKTPKSYRNQYMITVWVIIAIVVINGIFLFIPQDAIYTLLDYSIVGYSLALIVMYWSRFHYRENDMQKGLSRIIMDRIDQGIVLFNYQGEFTMKNKKADILLPELRMEEGVTLKEFIAQMGFSGELFDKESFSVQCYSSRHRALRCDYRKIFEQKDTVDGSLFIFTDIQDETDLMTGFITEEGLLGHYRDRESDTGSAGTFYIAICFDLNHLDNVNNTLGAEAGNARIVELASVIKKNVPPDAVCVRGKEAYLYAVLREETEETARKIALKVKRDCSYSLQYGISLTVRGAGQEQEVKNLLRNALLAMNNRKLLDQESAHSDLLGSLIRALKESDDDTEEHVSRTQKMGELLGERLKLTDAEQAQLSLLCMLHDIGKIGIPLEVLNKPGKLSESEWKILQTHVYKGYEICRSNSQLAPIADLVLHHHERWDGKGYPDGLSRESIPFLSRIISVVDSFDAMTHDRTYRRGMSVEEARKELIRCAGSQFDPKVVSEYLAVLDENPIPENDGKARNLTGVAYSRPESAAGLTDEEEKEEKEQRTRPVTYTRYQLDCNDRIVEVDDTFEALTGYSREDIKKLELNLSDLIPPEDRAAYLGMVSDEIRKKGFAYMEHRIRRKNGIPEHVICMGKPYYNASVKQPMSEIIVTRSEDIGYVKELLAAQSKRARRQLARWEETYRRDSLTDILNHGAFQNDVELKLLEGRFDTVLVMLDVDHFKQYNDTKGHSAGDEFLIFLAHALKDSIEERDLVSRMGGDEFSVAMFIGKGSRNREELMRDALSKVEILFDRASLAVRHYSDQTSISMGAAVAREGESFTSLYRRADQALYRSKEVGRNRLTLDRETETSPA